MAETWKPVPACRWFGIKAGVFEASDLGRVRTVDRTLSDGRRAGGVVLTPVIDKDGYERVKVAGRPFGVHVLVCLAFHGPPEVRHLGSSNRSNKPTELAWGSRRDNEQDKWKQREKERESRRTRPFPRATLPRTPVRLSQAVDLGILSGTIHAVRKGAQRDSTFPAAVSMDGLAKLYNPADLASWERRRRQL